MIKKILVATVSLICLFIISAIAYLIYLDRLLERDFSTNFSSTISACGKTFPATSDEYVNLKNWFSNHKKGWHTFYGSLPSNGTTFSSDEFQFIVGQDWVIVTTHNGTLSNNTQSKISNVECNASE